MNQTIYEPLELDLKKMFILWLFVFGYLFSRGVKLKLKLKFRLN